MGVLDTGSATEGEVPSWTESTFINCRGALLFNPVLRTSIWNKNLHGTGKLPVIHPALNDQALEPFPEHTFDGAIALLRRGGGIGFAQKTAVAEAAGALGCIV